jgi:acyl carrier protein
MQSEIEKEIAVLIVEVLNLEDVKAEDIDPKAPLFRDGLGLDSIDALELALAIQQKYGVQVSSDDEEKFTIFSSLSALSAYVEKSRGRG